MSEFKKQGGFRDRNRRDFKRKDFGRPSFGGRPDFNRSGGSRDGGDRQMFSATCAKCQQSCEVPFRPNGEKPVYCNNCFSAKHEDPARSYGRREFGAPQRNNVQPRDTRIDDLKKQIETLSMKLDKLMSMVRGNLVAVEVPEEEVETEVKIPVVEVVAEKSEKKEKKPAAKKKTAKKKK